MPMARRCSAAWCTRATFIRCPTGQPHSISEILAHAPCMTREHVDAASKYHTDGQCLDILHSRTPMHGASLWPQVDLNDNVWHQPRCVEREIITQLASRAKHPHLGRHKPVRVRAGQLQLQCGDRVGTTHRESVVFLPLPAARNAQPNLERRATGRARASRRHSRGHGRSRCPPRGDRCVCDHVGRCREAIARNRVSVNRTQSHQRRGRGTVT